MNTITYAILFFTSFSTLGFSEAAVEKSETHAAVIEKENISKIAIKNVWVRPANAGKNTAVYFDIHTDESNVSLTGASSDIGARTEIHTHISENGVMKMRKVEDIVCKPGVTTLKPGGDHVMLMDLKKDLKESDQEPVSVTLTFSKTTTLPDGKQDVIESTYVVNAPVKRPQV